MEDVERILSFLTILTGINSASYGEKGDIRALNEMLSLPGWLPPEDLSCQESLSLQSDALGLHYLICPLPEGGALRLGPFLRSNQEAGRISNIRDQLIPPYPRDFEIKGFFSLLEHKSPRDILYLGSLLQMSCSHFEPLDSLRGMEADGPSVSLQSTAVRDRRRIDGMYEMERKLRHCISRGDRETLLEMMNQPVESVDWLRRLPHNPLRLSRNIAVVLNTVSRLAAERGGLEPHFLHSISEKYAMKIEGSSSIESVRSIQAEMVMEYCDAVRKFALTNYSGLISRTVSLILQDLDGDVSLKTMARRLRTNGSYLSRQFKKETGVTYSEFVRQRRVDEAKWLMDRESLSISDIATRVGYSDLNYFSRVFRQVSGFSPREYRKNPMAGHSDGIPGEY